MLPSSAPIWQGGTRKTRSRAVCTTRRARCAGACTLATTSPGPSDDNMHVSSLARSDLSRCRWPVAQHSPRVPNFCSRRSCAKETRVNLVRSRAALADQFKLWSGNCLRGQGTRVVPDRHREVLRRLSLRVIEREPLATREHCFRLPLAHGTGC